MSDWADGYMVRGEKWGIWAGLMGDFQLIKVKIFF